MILIFITYILTLDFTAHLEYIQIRLGVIRDKGKLFIWYITCLFALKPISLAKMVPKKTST